MNGERMIEIQKSDLKYTMQFMKHVKDKDLNDKSCSPEIHTFTNV